MNYYDFEDNSKVKELKNHRLKNINKIIKVPLNHCTCGCNSDTYFWLLNTNNEWIPLPIISEDDDYEREFKYQDYVFDDNQIKLYEYYEEPIYIAESIYKNTRLKSKKLLKNFYWNGKRLILKKKDYQKNKSTNEIRYVTAKSGLVYRDKPKGKRVGKFKFKKQVVITKHTNIFQEIKNGNEIIKGEWVGIRIDNQNVYVFNGFLSCTKP